MYKTKLVRKQVLIDQDSLDQVEILLSKNNSKHSFSEYLRGLIQKDIDKIKQKSKTKIDLLALNTGFIKNGGFKTKTPEDLSKEIDKTVYGL